MDNRQRFILARLVVGYILIFLLLRLVLHATPSGMSSPPLYNVQLDITYWLYKLLHIPQFIFHDPVTSVSFDLLLFSSGFCTLLYPGSRKFLIPFSILLFIYALTYNYVALEHTHSVCGFMIVLIPFWFVDNRKFYLLWQGLRYYACYVYVCSFVWKAFVTQSLFHWPQGSETVRANLIGYLYFFPDSFYSSFVNIFLKQAWLLNAGNLLLVLLEGLMVLGFFTKRYDRFLFWIPVFIHVSTYFFSDVFFIEFLELDFALLSLTQIDAIGKRFSKIFNLLVRPRKIPETDQAGMV